LKYTKETIDKICHYIREGNTQRDAAILSHITEKTFYEWKKKSEFCEAVKKAETEAKEAMITIVRRAAVKHWAAAAWWLERRYKDEYALRTEMTGKDGKDLEQIKVLMPKNGVEAN